MEMVSANFEALVPLAPCHPPRWLRNPHTHTIAGHLLPSPRSPGPTERWEIPVPDGDRLVAFAARGPHPVVVYLFHGLSGCTRSSYMVRAALLCRGLGYSFVMVNHRGCGAGESLARLPYHSGRSDDLGEAVAEGRRRFPEAIHLAVGFSLSGNALLLLAAEVGSRSLPDAVISVNAPIDLADTAERLQRGWNRIYDRHFTRLCRTSVLRRMKLGLIRESYRFPRRFTLKDFDAIYTAPAGGFRDREQYYARCSARPHLERIRIPAVLLTSRDDPFVAAEAYETASLGPRSRLHLENYGGHLGYVNGAPTPLGSRRWLDHALAHYLVRLVSEVRQER